MVDPDRPRGRASLPNVSSEALANQPEKALDVGKLSAFLLDLLVGRICLEKRSVRLPKIAEAPLLLVAFRNLVPKVESCSKA
jgi:hypothetical protein